MAVTTNAVTTAAGSASAVLTWTHTVGAGTDRALYVGVGTDIQTVGAILSIAFGGVAMSRVAAVAGTGGFCAAFIYNLVNPTSGAGVISVQASQANALIAYSIDYAGVDQTTPTEAASTASGSAATGVTLNISSAAGNKVMDMMAIDDSANLPTVGAQQTQRQNIVQAFVRGAGSTESGSSTVTMSWGNTTSGSNWVTAVTSIKAAAAAAATIASFMTMLGVGS